MNGELFLRTAPLAEIAINRREAARYLGYRMELPEEIDALFDVCANELEAVAFPKACYAETAVSIDGDSVDLGFCRVESAALAKNLSGCRSAYVFAATLGVGVDRYLLRLSKTEQAKALVADALASAAVEGWCDFLNAELASGKQTKPRFSPGYGGVALSYQKDFISFLDATRKIGITLSETYFMTPVKSVTAIIGIKEVSV